MLSDQSADIGRIKQSSKNLTAIHREFTRNANPAEGLGVATLGDQGLVAVFDDFGDNWKIHRERLSDELKKLSVLLSTVARTYEDVDHALVEALRGTDRRKPSTDGGVR